MVSILKTQIQWKNKAVLYGHRHNTYKNGRYLFIAHIKTEDIYKDVVEDVEKRFDTSNYDVDRPLSMEKIKK